MRCLASSATAIFTPASAYFMRNLSAPVSATDSGKVRGPWFTSRNSFERRGGRRLPTAIAYRDKLKRVKNALPAHDPRMQKGAGISKKPLANLARLPGLGRHIQRHIDNHRRSNDVISRHAAPEAAIERVAAIVTQGQVRIWRNFVRKVKRLKTRVRRDVVRRRGFTWASGVLFNELLSVDPHRAVMNVHGVAGESDDAFHVVRLIRRKGRLEDDDLLALGTAPERDVQIGERHTGVVADAAHDEVVANEQRVFHRARGDDARLPNRAIDEEKREADPEPRDDLALNLGFHRHDFFLFRFLLVSFHVPPPLGARRLRSRLRFRLSPRRIFRLARLFQLPAAPDRSGKHPYNKTYRICLRCR